MSWTQVTSIVGAGGFDALSSFDRINLGSTLLQCAVVIAFAGALHGAARHFGRPAMGSIAVAWRLIAIAIFLNIFSTWAGAVWNDRALSRAITAVVIGVLAAAIPYVRNGIGALSAPDQPLPDVMRAAFLWGLGAFLLDAIGVFGSATALPNLRVVTVTWSRTTQFLVHAVPAYMAWTAWRKSRLNRGAIGLLAIAFASFSLGQGVAVALGLRVGMPDLPFSVSVFAIVLNVITVMIAGVCTLLAVTSEEVSLVNAQSQLLARTQERLASAERMESLGRMAAGVAHDLNNVLQVVEFTLESVRERDASDEIGLQQMEAAMKHGRLLTVQLLTFARARQTEPVRFDPVAQLRGITAILTAMAGPRLELVVSASVDGAALLMDPAQFEQVVINLVANARDAVEAGGRVRVQLDLLAVTARSPYSESLAPGDYVRILVEDSGAGISPEVRAHIFEPFFTTKRSGSGTGLGLATVHGIARQASGTVVLESELGRGTCFEVLLPAA